jgi:hypothetical protein
VYELEILDSVYRILVNDTSCIPPEIVMLSYCPSVSNNNCVELLLNDTITINEDDSQCFDIYIQHAENYPVNISSFLNAFSISGTSGCIDNVDFLYFENNSSGIISEPPALLTAPVQADNTEIQVIRIYCNIIPNTEPGIISISISTDLKDINNNYIQEDYNLTVLK